MDAQESQSSQRYDFALGVVAFVGLYQGAVPLMVQLLFDADQRFAPALWLPAPWWWVACLAIVLTALGVLATIHDAKERRFPSQPSGSQSPANTQQDSTEDKNGAGAYDAASAVVFLVGIYCGVAPFISRLFFDGDLLLALPLRLRAPWWWIASLSVIVVTVVLLGLIDHAKQRRHSP